MTHHSLTYRLRLAVVVALLSCSAADLLPAPAVAAPPVSFPEASAYAGTPRVGALFSARNGSLEGHFCTASVVDSPHRDLLVTAAHCVVAPGSGKARDDMVFVPGYRAGHCPYGRWTVRTAVVDRRWARSGDPDYDVAFLTTTPIGQERQVEDAVGAEAATFAASHRQSTAVAVGYPTSSQWPVHCAGRLHHLSSSQLEFDCAGLTTGTSGGPLLTGVDQTGSGPGALVGVIGGYQTGGATDDISYSPSFGPGIAAVYRTAVAQG
jgi:V8-like Glu-specific endopeptidase